MLHVVGGANTTKHSGDDVPSFVRFCDICPLLSCVLCSWYAFGPRVQQKTVATARESVLRPVVSALNF